MDIEKLAYDHGANIYENGEVRFYTLNAFNKFAEAYHQAKCNEEIQTLRAKVALVDVLVEALRKEQSAMIALAAEMAVKKNMPDVEYVKFSVNIPKKSWRSIMKMCANSTQQCNDWSYKLRGIADRLSALATYDKLSEVKHDTK